MKEKDILKKMVRRLINTNNHIDKNYMKGNENGALDAAEMVIDYFESMDSIEEN